MPTVAMLRIELAIPHPTPCRRRSGTESAAVCDRTGVSHKPGGPDPGQPRFLAAGRFALPALRSSKRLLRSSLTRIPSIRT